MNNLSDIDEDKFIAEALTTPYEKVIRILLNLKYHLEETKADVTMVKDLDWVVNRIQSQKLYTYEHSDNTAEFEKRSKNSQEVKSFFEYLNNFSECKEIKRRTNKKLSLTVKPKERQSRKRLIIKEEDNESSSKGGNCLMKAPSKKQSAMPPRYNSLYSYIEEKINHSTIPILKFDYQDDDDFSPINKKYGIKHFLAYDESSIQISENTQQCDLIFADDTSEEDENKLTIKEIYYEFDKIFEFDFNIFEFEEIIGKPYVLIEGAKTIFEYLDLSKFLTIENFNNFLTNVRNGYKDSVSYHNSLHAFDVCQTIIVILDKTNIADLVGLTEYDQLALILSALVHDIGHPGYNNTFQINTFSDIALTYNDKSVLEHFHVSEAFKIVRRPECNIFTKMEMCDFRNVRRRMIETVLATDMIYHARIQSYMKNRLSVKNIKNGVNLDKLIDKDSLTIFEDQQEIVNFLIHTADISHNSKDFKISFKWTSLLMEEFWKQGDVERSLNLPISFLCDRTTADVPKSQIGFITGIIIPTFDVLSDMFPSLSYYKDNAHKNIEKWRDIIEKKDNSNPHLYDI